MQKYTYTSMDTHKPTSTLTHRKWWIAVGAGLQTDRHEGLLRSSFSNALLFCFVFFLWGGTWFSFVLACKIQTAENETRVSVLARRRAACIFIAAYFAAWHLKGAVLCASSNAAASSRCLTVGGGLFCMQLTWPCTIALGWCVCIWAFLQKKTCVFKVWVRHRSGLTYIILCDHTQTHRM